MTDEVKIIACLSLQETNKRFSFNEIEGTWKELKCQRATGSAKQQNIIDELTISSPEVFRQALSLKINAVVAENEFQRLLSIR